jgi:hypothetical protein
LLFLEAENPDKPISCEFFGGCLMDSFWSWRLMKQKSVYINSPGGSVTAGMAIYDTVWFLYS